jgi:hypothetical protein
MLYGVLPEKMNCIKGKKHRTLNPSKNRANIRRYFATENGRATLLLNNAKDRAKRQSLPIDIDLEFILSKLQEGVCEITAIPFDFEIQRKFKANPLCPSLDRIIPSRGYIKGNVRMVCFAVNVMHHDWPDSLMLRLSELIVMNKEKLHHEHDASD